MKPSFNLLERPWMPCIRRDGTPLELGLRETLAQAHQLRELHGESPLVTAALYRLLLAVLHRVFGPRSRDQWKQLWSAGRWDMAQLDAYFERWQQRFDLFDAQRPFYQAPDQRVKPKSVISLIYEVASGNNPTLFDHHTEDEGITLTPAQAARMLLAIQAFGLAGLSGVPQKFTDAPCANGIIFLVQGDTLFETLMLNMLRYPDPDSTWLPYQPADCPAWEMDDPFSPERSVPFGYLDYLTWQNRRIMFFPESAAAGLVVRQMTMAPALRLESDVLDPMKHYRRDEKRGPLPLSFREGRALWRDSAALFRLRDRGYQVPRTFVWLAGLVGDCLSQEQTRRCLALGMSKKQAKVNFYRTEHLPLPLAYLRDGKLVESLQMVLDMAEAVRQQLWGAGRTLATFVLAPQADAKESHQPQSADVSALVQQWGIERRYWSQLELPFRAALETLPQDREQALLAWRETLRRTAWKAFSQVAEDLRHNPRALKAVVRASGQLAAGLAKVLPDS